MNTWYRCTKITYLEVIKRDLINTRFNHYNLATLTPPKRLTLYLPQHLTTYPINEKQKITAAFTTRDFRLAQYIRIDT